MQLEPPRSNQAADRERSAAVRRMMVENFNDIDKMVDTVRFNAVQLGKGPSGARVAFFDTHDFHIARISIVPSSLVQAEITSDLTSFIIPLRWKGHLACNGNTALPTRFYQFCKGDDYFWSADGFRDLITVGFSYDELSQTIAALRGIDPEDTRHGYVARDLPENLLDQLKRCLTDGLDRLTLNAGRFDDEKWLRDGVETMKTTVIDYLLHATPEEMRDSRARYMPTQLVRRAEDRFMEADGGPVSLADLCAATGVSASTLTAAFNFVCGETPARYFKLRRFSNARVGLFEATITRGAVKRAALAAGLTELGRFSTEYRELFGETPSATLASAMARKSGSAFHRADAGRSATT